MENTTAAAGGFQSKRLGQVGKNGDGFAFTGPESPGLHRRARQLQPYALLFHGIFASRSPIPHQSVVPAKTSPAPTKAESPMK